MERRLCTVDQRHIGPELLATLTTPMPSMKRNDLAGGRIQDPSLFFSVQPVARLSHLSRARLSDDHGCW